MAVDLNVIRDENPDRLEPIDECIFVQLRAVVSIDHKQIKLSNIHYLLFPSLVS